jgi:ribosomal protein S18 acetylase RimI-like enzyme
MTAIDIRRIEEDQGAAVAAAGHLFDDVPRRDRTEDFLNREGHHLLIAYVDDGPVGFVTGVEIAHPDKGVEMLLYELGVDETHRRQGVARSLVKALWALARQQGCRGMWVPIEPGNEAATATYRAAGAGPPESAGIMTWPPS